MTNPIRAAAERLLQQLDQRRASPDSPLFLERAEDELRAALATPTPPVDGEAEELAEWLDGEAKRCAAQFHDRITRAAALLRQLPPKGLEAIRYSVVDDGAVIQRTNKAQESWAVRSGSSCMSTAGEWEIEPTPSERTDEWLATHRWPTLAAAWAALQQAGGEQ